MAGMFFQFFAILIAFNMAYAEKIEFQNRIESGGQACFLENLSETTQGKSLLKFND